MNRIVCFILCFCLIVALSVPCFASDSDDPADVAFSYYEWLGAYALCDCDVHLVEYGDSLSYANVDGIDVEHPAVVTQSVYDFYYPTDDVRNEVSRVVSENSGSSRPSVPSGVSDLGSYLSGLFDGQAHSSLQTSAVPSALYPEADAASLSSADSSFDSQPSGISLDSDSIPSLNSSIYAPDAQEGSLLSVLYGLLGKPRVASVYERSTASGTVFSIVDIPIDWSWVGSLFLLCLVLFSVFKAGGALLCKR